MRTSASALRVYNLTVNETPGRTLNLIKGQLIIGQVLEAVDAEHAVIEINGQRVFAESQIDLVPGQQIMVQVQGRKQGQVELKLVSLPPELANTTLPLGRLQQVLEGAGLTLNEANAHLVEALLAYNVSPTPENLRTAVHLLQLTGLDQQGQISVAKLLSHNLDLEPELLLLTHLTEQQAAVAQAQDLHNDTSDWTTQLGTALTKLVQSLPQLLPTMAGEDNLVQQQLARLGIELMVEGDNQGKEIQSLVEDWVATGLSEITTEEFTHLNKLLVLQKGITQEINTVAKEVSQGLSEKHPRESQQVAKLLTESAHGLEKHLDATRQLQSNPAFRENSSLVYLPLPMIINQQVHTSQLYAWKRGKKAKADQDSHYILLILQTVHMGELKIHLEAKADSLGLQFFVETPAALKLIEATKSKLIAALGQGGFTVQGVNCHLVANKTLPKAKPQSVSFVSGIDVTI